MNTHWEIEKIIEVSIDLKRTGSSPGSLSEQIAAAFVVDNQAFLPDGWEMVEAWDRLGPQWQHYVRLIKSDYVHLIESA